MCFFLVIPMEIEGKNDINLIFQLNSNILLYNIMQRDAKTGMQHIYMY